MTYEEVKATYYSYFREVRSYSFKQAGKKVFLDKMAYLEDKYPEWVEAIEDEAFELGA